MSPFEFIHTVMQRDPWGALVLALVVWWVLEEIRDTRN